MHQAMLLTVQARISHLIAVPELTCYPRACISTGTVSPSAPLSWPHGTEFVDSYLKLGIFTLPSFWLSHDDSRFSRLSDDILFSILRSLADIDCRKSLIGDRMLWELNGSSNGIVFGISATSQTLSHTVFEGIDPNEFDGLVPAAFISVCFRTMILCSR